jgi:hypothetical protein
LAEGIQWSFAHLRNFLRERNKPMPELPEVETIARGVNLRVHGRKILSVWLGSKPEPFRSTPAEIAAILTGSTIEQVRRIGKHIVVDLTRSTGRKKTSPRAQWLVHLGMTGRLLVSQAQEPIAPHTHAILTLDDAREIRFVADAEFPSNPRSSTRSFCMESATSTPTKVCFAPVYDLGAWPAHYPLGNWRDCTPDYRPYCGKRSPSADRLYRITWTRMEHEDSSSWNTGCISAQVSHAWYARPLSAEFCLADGVHTIAQTASISHSYEFSDLWQNSSIEFKKIRLCCKVNPFVSNASTEFRFGPTVALRVDKPVHRTPARLRVGVVKKFQPGEPYSRVSSENIRKPSGSS